jgi:hypothetical protein
VFGGNGYVVVVPDYLGLGESTVSQPYMVAAAQRDAAVDMLRAVRTLARTKHLLWNPTLLLPRLLAGRYCAYYGHPFADAFPPALAKTLPAALNGTREIEEIAPLLPTEVQALFKPAFLRQAGWA